MKKLYFSSLSDLKKKQYTIIILGVILLVITLAACGESPSGNGKDTEGRSGVDPTGSNVSPPGDLVYINEKTGDRILFPESWAGHFLINAKENDQTDDKVVVRIYSKKNYDSDEYLGFVFAILRYSMEEFFSGEHNGFFDTVGIAPFATKKEADGKEFIYILSFANDVQYDPQNEELKDEYHRLSADASLVIQSLATENGLENYVSDITLTKFRNGEPQKGAIVFPAGNREGQHELAAIFERLTPTARASVNDVPDVKVFILVTFPDMTKYYIYEKNGRYYAEKPYQSISEISKADYEAILTKFGPILPDPDTLNKDEFLEPIQDMIARYAAGNPPENPMEHKFDQLPVGAPLPVVNTIDDFILDEGSIECVYTGIVRFGNNGEHTMTLQFDRFNDIGGAERMGISGVFFDWVE